MEALRDHPFFASINWGTLWTGSVPPLEPGLVKKEPPNGANGARWDDDVGASWDALVGDSDPEDDISWASEGEDQDVFATQGAKAPNGYAYYEDVGPTGELRPYAFPPAPGPSTDNATPPNSTPSDAGKDEGPSVRFASIPKAGATNGVGTSNGVLTNGVSSSHDVPSVVKAQPIDVPAFKGAVVDSYSTGSATSSSDSSPIEQLGSALQAAGIDRGRNRAQTPIQGNRPAADPEW